jgi:ABC-type nitrate/sulfonate/bicarbonate transport system substrate-binding protein
MVTKMKKKIFTAFLLISIIVLNACTNNTKTEENNTTDNTKTAEDAKTADATAKEKVRIVLDWTPNTNHTGLYAAKEKGYFSKQGLDVEIMQPPEGSTTSLVGAGGAEFGISFQDTLASSFASKESVPVTAVAAIIQHNTSGILSLKKTEIDTPSKMAGHSYATWDTPIELAMIKKIVEDDGGKYKDVKLIPNTVTDVVTALQTNVESIWVYYAWDGIAAEVAGLDTNYLNFADYGTELDYYTPVLIANDKFLKNKPETVKKALSAIQKGYEFAIKNPDEAADILLKAVPELDNELVKKSQKWLSDKYKAEVEQWGYIDQKRWDSFYSWLYQNKLIENEIPSGKGFSNDYLSK